MDQTIFLIVGIVFIIVLMFLPQWQAQRRIKKQIASLQPGDEVITIGGIIGKLTGIDTEKNRARVEIAPGVEIQMVLTAVNRAPTPLDEAGRR